MAGRDDRGAGSGDPRAPAEPGAHPDPLSFDPRTWTTPPRRAADLDAALATVGPAPPGRGRDIVVAGLVFAALLVGGGAIAYLAGPDSDGVSTSKDGGRPAIARDGR